MLNSNALAAISSLYDAINRDIRELSRLHSMRSLLPADQAERGINPRSLISISDSADPNTQASVAFHRRPGVEAEETSAEWEKVWLSLIDSLSKFLQMRIALNKAELTKFGFEWDAEVDIGNVVEGGYARRA